MGGLFLISKVPRGEARNLSRMFLRQRSSGALSRRVITSSDAIRFTDRVVNIDLHYTI